MNEKIFNMKVSDGSSNTLWIIFSSWLDFNENRWITQNDLWDDIKNDSTSCNDHVIILKDLQQCWYLYGISNKYPDIHSVIDILLQYIVDNKIHKVNLLGFSMGAYAATLYGKILSLINTNIDVSVLGFSGRSDISRNAFEVMENKKIIWTKYIEIITIIENKLWINENNIALFLNNKKYTLYEIFNLDNILKYNSNIYIQWIYAEKSKYDSDCISNILKYIHPNIIYDYAGHNTLKYCQKNRFIGHILNMFQEKQIYEFKKLI